MDIQKFNACMADVIRWNAVARDGVHDFSPQAVVNQTDYIHEELMETIVAVATKNDSEVLDGVADVFVTLAYKYFLMTGKTSFELIPGYDSNDNIIFEGRGMQCALLSFVSMMACENVDFTEDLDIDKQMFALFDLVDVVSKHYLVDMAEVIEHVMASNWSKFPRAADCAMPNHMCRDIELARDKKDVDWRRVSSDGVDYIVFRDNGGAGKIMKPLTYTEADCAQFLQ